MTEYQKYSHEQWLKARCDTIGGSDAAAVMGLHPAMSNLDLWEIKTGAKQQADISDLPFVKYGIAAEPYMRELFALDHPQYKVDYEEGNIWHNDKFPFAHASLDGWLTDKDGRRGILEIKTTTILNSAQKEKWNDRIPDNYYCQLLHYFMVTGFEFAILKAQIKYDYDDVFIVTKHYHIEREDVTADIDLLAEKEENFCRYVKNGKRPPLILPPIFRKEDNMELRISELQLPEKIVFNYAELKAEVTERIKKYETLVYTDADIKDAKSDRADLNKLKKALNDERIRLEKEYLQPFNTFKTEINEIIGIIDVPVGLIDKQIKEVEKRKKEDKKAAVKALYEKIQHPAWLEFELLFREDWLKSSYSLSHIEKQVLPDNIAAHIRNAETLVNLPEFGFEAMEVYKKSLDMAEALNKAKEMSEIAKKKAEQIPTEQRVLPKPQPTEEVSTSQETVVKEASGWVSFSALLTVSQAKELKEFFNSRNITFRPMKGE